MSINTENYVFQVSFLEIWRIQNTFFDRRAVVRERGWTGVSYGRSQHHEIHLHCQLQDVGQGQIRHEHGLFSVINDGGGDGDAAQHSAGDLAASMVWIGLGMETVRCVLF